MSDTLFINLFDRKQCNIRYALNAWRLVLLSLCLGKMTQISRNMSYHLNIYWQTTIWSNHFLYKYFVWTFKINCIAIKISVRLVAFYSQRSRLCDDVIVLFHCSISVCIKVWVLLIIYILFFRQQRVRMADGQVSCL